MSRSFPWIWIALAGLLLLLPGPAGRFLLDLLGGITLTLILLPLLAGGAALIGTQVPTAHLQGLRGLEPRPGELPRLRVSLPRCWLRSPAIRRLDGNSQRLAGT